MFSKRREDPNAVIPPPLNNEKDNGIWIFVGNLTEEISEVEVRELFTEFGQVNKIFLNTKLGFASVQMATLQGAGAAIENLNGLFLYGKEILLKLPSQGKMEINTFSSTSIKVENLSPMVTNELLLKAFSQFGVVEKAVVSVDSKGQSTTRGIVEFKSELSAQNAVKQIEEGCFLTTTYPKPLEAKLMEDEDSICGLSEEKITKTPEYYNEIKVGPRMAVQGTFEEELARTYKVRYQLERKQREQFEANIAISRRIFEEEMLTCWTKQQQALNIKQEVLSFEERLEEEESKKKFEARRRIQMEKQIMEMNQREEDVDETPPEKEITYSIPMLTGNVEQETSIIEASQIEEITTNDTGLGHKRNLPNHDDKGPGEKKRTIKKRRVEKVKEEVNEEGNEGPSSSETVLWPNNNEEEVATIPDFSSMSVEQLAESFNSEGGESKAKIFLTEHGVLRKDHRCGKCNQPCKYNRSRGCFSCYRTTDRVRCTYTKGELKGTMFASKKIEFADFMKFLTLYLSKDFSITRVQTELDWSKTTIIRWCQICGKVCQEFCKNQHAIGGAGTVVEVDNTYICKRKHSKGCLLTQFWVLSGRERGTNKKFFSNLEGKPRTAEYVIPLIKQHVLPGSKIITDTHYSYSPLESSGYEHETVSHRSNCIQDGIHTLTIERFWRDVKEHVEGGTSSRNVDFLSLHIFRYILISSFDNGRERLDNFLTSVAALYPL